MAGRKLFTNLTPHPVLVTLCIRASEDPRRTAGTKEFVLQGGESQWQEYGDRIDIYLNGIRLCATPPGPDAPATSNVVITRGSALDNMLNMRNAVDIAASAGAFILSGRQVN
jgi:hypothetical protein